MKWRRPRALRQPRLDPYLAWAEETAWRGFRRTMGQRLGVGDSTIDTLRLLVQARDAEAAQRLMHQPEWTVAAAYRRPGLRLRHFVAEMPLANLPWLKGLSPDELCWELALPRRDADTVARAQAVGSHGETRSAQDFRSTRHFDIDPPARRPKPIKGPVMAVIDFGCPFMNDAFAAEPASTRANPPGRTRLQALWDQGTKCEPPPAGQEGVVPPWPWAPADARMGYGRELHGSTMNRVLDACRSADEVIDEAEAYRRLDYLIDYDDPRRRVWNATHGSHVLSVAAGWPDPLRGAGAERDAAARAPLVFVQLPSLTAADSSGASLCAQVLDAMHYVLDICEPGADIVVVLSYGSFAGPHDGSSLIEQALDELVQTHAGRLAIVLGAGNGHQAACHLRRSVRPERSALLRVHLDKGDLTDTFVETWFSPCGALLPRLRARARAGDGNWSDWIGPGYSVQMREPGDPRALARLSFQDSVPNGSKPLLLLALAPTDRPADDDGPLASPGSWQIEIQLEPEDGQALPQDAEVYFDAWVERDDPGWLGHGVQPRFAEQRAGDDEQTLNSLATGRHTLVAGGFRLSDGSPAAYSSTGSRLGPALVYAVCEESALWPNIAGAATRSSDRLRMNGTSVAAPVLARRIFNWMADTAGSPGGAPDWAMILPAVVDVEQALALLEERASLLRFDRPRQSSIEHVPPDAAGRFSG